MMGELLSQNLGEIIDDPYKPYPSFATWLEASDPFTVVDNYANKIRALTSDPGYSGIDIPYEMATTWAVIDTGAIEGLYEVDRGFTYSVALQVTKWEDLPSIKGESATQSMKDALVAYEWILDYATGHSEVSEYWFKELHAKICDSQDTYTVFTDLGSQEQSLAKGQYKIHRNNPVNPSSRKTHNYCPPLDVAPEMHRLVTELRSPEFLDAHPVLQMAYSHYAFVSIHPFPDGNGRVARALASVFSYKNYQIPLVIFADQKMEYFDALESADDGNFKIFIDYVADRVVDAIGMIVAEFYKLARPSIEELQFGMQRNLLSRGGFPFTFIDAIGLRLLGEFEREFKEESESHSLISEFRITYPTGYAQNANYRIPGYRVIAGNHPIFSVQLGGNPPVSASISRQYDVCVAQVEHVGADFIITRDGILLFEVFLREVNPSILESFTKKSKSFAAGEFRDLVADATNMASKNLKEQGYS